MKDALDVSNRAVALRTNYREVKESVWPEKFWALFRKISEYYLDSFKQNTESWLFC